jgi:diguanylate cyclase (GGDEF)-like protein/PAS domain S-box-containing protein
MDRVARRFGVPGGLAAGGVIGGALVIGAAALGALAGRQPSLETLLLAVGLLAGIVAIIASTLSLVRTLRSTRAALEHTTRRVEEAGARMKVLVEHVPAAVYIDQADAGVSDGGRLSYMSPQVSGILGYRPEEFVEDPELWPSLIHPDDRPAAIAAYAEHWRTGRPLRAEYRMLARDGTEIWIRDEAFALPDEASGQQISQGLLVETTERKRFEAKLMHDALHDPLTGLANRVLFRDHLERALVRRRRAPATVALLFVDLDDFKVINDTLGHGSGDEVLVQVGSRLVEAIRADDIAARPGGDEFTVLIGEIHGVEEAEASAERILLALRRPIQLGTRSIAVGGSIGIALATGRATTADDLMGQADAAMYAAKAAGKGSHAVYGAETPLRVVPRLEAAG